MNGSAEKLCDNWDLTRFLLIVVDLLKVIKSGNGL